MGKDFIHLDLFSGIAGFAIAVDQVWSNAKHTFCEINPYCKALLKLRFPMSVVFDDIHTLTKGRFMEDVLCQNGKLRKEVEREALKVDILTGGFP